MLNYFSIALAAGLILYGVSGWYTGNDTYSATIFIFAGIMAYWLRDSKIE